MADTIIEDYKLLIDLTEEAMSYVPEYFLYKWEMPERLAELKTKYNNYG